MLPQETAMEGFGPSPASSLSEKTPMLCRRRLQPRNEPSWLKRDLVHSRSFKTKKDLRAARIIIFCGMGAGALWMLIMVAVAYLQTNRHTYSLVFEDHFSGPQLDSTNWARDDLLGSTFEATFDQSTSLDANAHVVAGVLQITPTLHAPYEDGAVIDLRDDSTCAVTSATDCMARQNGTIEVIPIVQTARLRTRRSITFGRVEVQARLPKGDWLYSTIAMEPVDNTYGVFPASGRIDIAQARGNARGFVSGGTERVDSMLHFGADGHVVSDLNYKARNAVQARGLDFSQEYHIFGLEWTPDSIRTYLDKPSNIMLEYSWPAGFWLLAKYNKDDPRLNKFMNPYGNGTRAAPFDVPFQLVLRVNAGGINGIFADGPTKPWTDTTTRQLGMQSFNAANSSWLPSWATPEARSLKVKSVKMWQQVR